MTTRNSGVMPRTVVSLGGRLGAGLLQALLLAAMARALGVASFGIYAVTFATVGTFIGVTDLGLTTRTLAIDRVANRPSVYGSLLVFKGVAACLVLLSAFGLGVAGYWPEDTGALVMLAAAAAIGEALGNTSLSIHQGEKASGRAVVLLLLRRTFAMVPFAFGISNDAALASLAVSALLGMTIFVSITLRRYGRPRNPFLVARGNAGIILAGLGPNLSQLDAVVVGLFAGVSLAGLHGAATRFSAPVLLAVVTVMQVLIPEMASAKSETRRRWIFGRARRLAAIPSLALILASIGAPWITEVILGPEFSGASPIVAGVLIAAAIITVSQVYLGWFYATKVPRIVGAGMLGAAFVRLVLCALLGSEFGAVGLGVALPVTAAITLSVLHLSWIRTVRGQPEVDDASSNSRSGGTWATIGDQ